MRGSSAPYRTFSNLCVLYQVVISNQAPSLSHDTKIVPRIFFSSESADLFTESCYITHTATPSLIEGSLQDKSHGLWDVTKEAITLTPLPSTVFESLLFPDLPFGFSNCMECCSNCLECCSLPLSKNLFSEYLVALMQMSTLSEAFSPPFPNSRQVGISSISSSHQLDTSIRFVPGKQLPCAVFNAKSSASPMLAPLSASPISKNASTLHS